MTPAQLRELADLWESSNPTPRLDMNLDDFYPALVFSKMASYLRTLADNAECRQLATSDDTDMSPQDWLHFVRAIRRADAFMANDDARARKLAQALVKEGYRRVHT